MATQFIANQFEDFCYLLDKNSVEPFPTKEQMSSDHGYLCGRVHIKDERSIVDVSHVYLDRLFLQSFLGDKSWNISAVQFICGSIFENMRFPGLPPWPLF